jgi:hypothetical protein
MQIGFYAIVSAKTFCSRAVPGPGRLLGNFRFARKPSTIRCSIRSGLLEFSSFYWSEVRHISFHHRQQPKALYERLANGIKGRGSMIKPR